MANELKFVPFHIIIVKHLENCENKNKLNFIIDLMETSLPPHMSEDEKENLLNALGKVETSTNISDVAELVERGKIAIASRETKEKPEKKDSDTKD